MESDVKWLILLLTLMSFWVFLGLGGLKDHWQGKSAWIFFAGFYPYHTPYF